MRKVIEDGLKHFRAKAARYRKLAEQAEAEVARLEALAQQQSQPTMREPDASPVCLCPADGFYPLCPIHRQPGRGLR